MESYDPNKRYFGPQGSRLCNIIPAYPPGVLPCKAIFNKAGYNHDGGYNGKRRSGFFGRILDAYDRWRIDQELLTELQDGIKALYDEGMISFEQAKASHAYANLAYNAIRAGGWLYFRTGEDNE